MLVCVFYVYPCTRDRGCSAHPVFPAPSPFLGANEFAKLGRSVSRECGGISTRHARAGGHPVFRDVDDGNENSRRTGYSAFAEYDGSRWSIVINVIARSTCDEAIHLFLCGPWIASLALAMTKLEPLIPNNPHPSSRPSVPSRRRRWDQPVTQHGFLHLRGIGRA
jgi:hypothetical protein